MAADTLSADFCPPPPPPPCAPRTPARRVPTLDERRPWDIKAAQSAPTHSAGAANVGCDGAGSDDKWSDVAAGVFLTDRPGGPSRSRWWWGGGGWGRVGYHSFIVPSYKRDDMRVRVVAVDLSEAGEFMFCLWWVPRPSSVRSGRQ